MFDTPEVMRLAQEMARHAGARQAEIAKNIANADTPGYRARDLSPFSDAYEKAAPSQPMRTTRADHMIPDHAAVPWRVMDAGGEAAPNGNNVSLEHEMARGTDAKSAHDTALTVYRNSLDLLRTALGRGR